MDFSNNNAGGIAEWIFTNASSTTNIGDMAFWSPKPQEVTEVAIAQPVADPGLNVDPVQAAKELRSLMRLVLDYMDSAHEAQVSPTFTAIAHRLSQMDSYVSDLEAALNRADVALMKRQTSPGRQAIADVRHSIAQLKTQRRYIGETVASENVQQGMTFNHYTLTHLKQSLEKMHVLIQSFPTIKEAPSTIPENVLRTVAVILENAGYVAKKKPDDLPELDSDIENNDENDDDDDDYDESEEG